MSTLVAIAHPDSDTAESVRQEQIRATKEHQVQLEEEERLRSALEGAPA